LNFPVIKNCVLTGEEEDGKMIVNGKLVWIWKEALISYFEVLSQHLDVVTEKNKQSQDLW
jgi:hypothetical protein